MQNRSSGRFCRNSDPILSPVSDIWVVYRAFFGIKPPKAQVKLGERADSSCKTTQKMTATPTGPPTTGTAAACHGNPGAPGPSLPYSFCALWRRYSKVPAMMHSSICSTVGENQMPSTWNSRPMMNTTTHTMIASAMTSVFDERESSTA